MKNRLTFVICNQLESQEDNIIYDEVVMIIRKLKNLLNVIMPLFFEHYFGFVQGHSYLKKKHIHEIKNLLAVEDYESKQLVHEFEILFSSFVGEGKCISFAAARMAFYSLMMELGIGIGDEVILQALNCSVMANAVLRTGATPVFADIDIETFGSSAKSIENKITQRTKMIVAQHSFGIPCSIAEITRLAQEKKIFLLEDCALAFGSTTSGITVGNWGDAAIFSTNNSKPINCMLGGLFYTKNDELLEKIERRRDLSEDLSKEYQELLFHQFIFERKYLNPKNCALGNIINYFKVFLEKLNLKKVNATGLNDDCFIPHPNYKHSYPYPAKLPAFVAKLGILELERWNIEKNNRVALFKKYLDLFNQYDLSQYLPKAYFDPTLSIIPLRFVFNYPKADDIRLQAINRFDVNGYLFLKPLVACNEPSDFGYRDGCCTLAEKSVREIINFPCVLDHFYDNNLLKVTRYLLTSVKF